MDVIINGFVNNVVNYMQLSGPCLGFVMVVLESIFPFLPLCVFIAFNVEAFGMILGFLISLSATIVGCLLSYYFFRFIAGNKIDKYINKNKKKKEKLNKIVKTIRDIKFSTLVVIMALPFAPAFLINIACGLLNVKFKKFFLALLISKNVIVYFWGFIGTSILDSFMDIGDLMKVILLLLVAFIVSKLVMKKYNIE